MRKRKERRRKEEEERGEGGEIGRKGEEMRAVVKGRYRVNHHTHLLSHQTIDERRLANIRVT